MEKVVNGESGNREDGGEKTGAIVEKATTEQAVAEKVRAGAGEQGEVEKVVTGKGVPRRRQNGLLGFFVELLLHLLLRHSELNPEEDVKGTIVPSHILLLGVPRRTIQYLTAFDGFCISLLFFVSSHF